MFKFIRRLIYLAVILFIVGFLLIIMFPNHYEKESVIDIDAPAEKVFTNAEKLGQWNMYAMLSGYTEMTKQSGDKTKPANDPVDRYAGQIKNQIGSMEMKVSLVKADYPRSLSYKIEGGPMNGMQPEMYFAKIDDKKTRVTHKERYMFSGFFGSIKAFAAKYGTGRLTENGLTNLKKISEQPNKE